MPFYIDNWKEVLKGELDMSTLPVHWGGAAMGPNRDPYCQYKVSPDLVEGDFNYYWNKAAIYSVTYVRS